MDTRKKILVIDDEADIRDIVRMYLTEAGYDVIEASNGQEGILRAQGEKPDLIVLDIMMPGINGFEVAKHLKDDPNTASIPILILSVLAQDSEFRHGILDYVSKPFKQVELVSKVKNFFLTLDTKNTHTVLIVDDDPDIVDVIALCLRDNKVLSEKAFNGPEALEKLKTTKVDLVLLDINMPGMNGFDVIKHLKADPKTAELPVIVLTGTWLSESDKKHGITLGVSKYLTKPFSADELVREITSAFHV